MKRIAFFLLLLLPLQLFSAPLNLLQEFSSAETGSYFVTLRNKNYTLFLIRGSQERALLLEEITIPKSYRIRNKIPWDLWIKQGAPGSTAWVRYEIDRETGRLDNYYSYLSRRRVDLSQADNFLSKLLSLSFQEVSDYSTKGSGRRKEKTRRWQPKLVFHGRTLPQVEFAVWQARWPKDGGELSNTVIQIYLPKEPGPYPSCFPYCLKLFGLASKTEMRVVDSGRLSDLPP